MGRAVRWTKAPPRPQVFSRAPAPRLLLDAVGRRAPRGPVPVPRGKLVRRGDRTAARAVLRRIEVPRPAGQNPRDVAWALRRNDHDRLRRDARVAGEVGGADPVDGLPAGV